MTIDVNLTNRQHVFVSTSFGLQIEKLKNNKVESAFLIGRQHSDGISFNVHYVIKCSEQDVSAILEEKQHVENHLPAGIKVIGAWFAGIINEEHDYLDNLLVKCLHMNFAQVVLLMGGNYEKAFVLNPSESASEFGIVLTPAKNIADNHSFIMEDTVTVRVDAILDFDVQMRGDSSEDFASAVNARFGELESHFLATSNGVETRLQNNVYRLKDSSILLTDGVTEMFDYNGLLNFNTATVYDLWKIAVGDERKSRKKVLRFDQATVDFQLLEDVTEDEEENSLFVPVIHCISGNFTCMKTQLKLKPLVICASNLKISDMPCLLNEAILRQLYCARECMLQFKFVKNGHNKLITPEPFWFYLADSQLFLAAFYPKDMQEDQLEFKRRELCSYWSLPINRPVLRRMNNYRFPDESGLFLRNVHESLTIPFALNSIVALVDGNYEYRHYMQDNFDDKGWGCAYRSFQTILSWFQLQGYTDQNAASHRQIQQALVDIGDRPASFLGTKQWIGSLELSYCLSHMLNIESKIVNISSRDELCSRVRELIAHFQQQGTPIMIGGGVLAHTIIGVCFCEETGEARFLVLDPHYTGDEDIKTIVDKGWCGWKPVTFWDEGTFYNLLLPQRPLNII